MTKKLLRTEGDFSLFCGSAAHPKSDHAFYLLDRMLRPESYPVMVCWLWDKDDYTGMDALRYNYVYPSDFL